MKWDGANFLSALCYPNSAQAASCAYEGRPARGGHVHSLIATAKLNGVDPQAWLADVLTRINDPPASRLDDLLPWNWSAGAAPVRTA